MRSVAVVTVGRSDYGVYRPLLRRIAGTLGLELKLIVAGAHFAHRFGATVNEISEDGFAIAAGIDLPAPGDVPGDIARVMGKTTAQLAHTYEDIGPDILVVLGDRAEMHAAAVAAVPFLIPMAHIGGGALTGGAIDDGFRHSISKLAHLHFVEIDAEARRLRQMGEAPWRVHVTGALGLDNLANFTPQPIESLNERFGLALEPGRPPLLVTLHPVTRELARTGAYISELLAALAECGMPVVFTYPNADSGGGLIIAAIESHARDHADAWAVPHLGTHGYFSLMAHAAAMVGNSSSGLIEAASFKLPVVNIGRRQEGRLAPENVIPCGHGGEEIVAAIARATDPAFRAGLGDLVNPYGDGQAARRMVEVLEAIDLDDPKLINKEFYEATDGVA